MAEYSSNSNKSRNNEVSVPQVRRVEPVVTGTAVAQKKSRLGKIKDSIIAESFGNVVSYLCTEVVIPAAKSLLYDLGTKGLHRTLYGSSSDIKQTNTSKISYGSYFISSPGSVRMAEPSKTLVNSSVFDYDNIYFSNRGDAEAVLETMCDMLETYQVVSVGDMYDLSNVDTSNYLVNDYGWTSLAGAKVMGDQNGYFIRFPSRAKELRKPK